MVLLKRTRGTLKEVIVVSVISVIISVIITITITITITTTTTRQKARKGKDDQKGRYHNS